MERASTFTSWGSIMGKPSDPAGSAISSPTRDLNDIQVEEEAPSFNFQPVTTQSIFFPSNTTSMIDFSSNTTSNQKTQSNRKSDGYNWRKYGQKQVKGSENFRGYFKCTFPNCPSKKKVETSIEGDVMKIVYDGTHNHPKPSLSKRSAHSNHVEQVRLPEHSTCQDEDDLEAGSIAFKSEDEEEIESECKRWKGDEKHEQVPLGGSGAMKEPKIIVQTRSEIDVLDDGYRWRKYGQKVVKGNTNPRSYYKCTSIGCQVRKHVERSSHDASAVLTAYEGKHNHDVPAARGSANNTMIKPPINNGNMTTAIKPTPIAYHSKYALNYSDNPPKCQTLAASSGQQLFTMGMDQSYPNFGDTGARDQPCLLNSFSTAREEAGNEFHSFFQSC